MKIKGKITRWNDDKGFGFAEPCSGGKPVFLHIKALRNRGNRPQVGQLVTYSLGSDKQGRPCATGAVLAGDRAALVPKRPPKGGNGSLSLVVAGVFLLLVALATLSGKLPTPLLVIYLALSLITFGFYAADKAAAQQGQWRTPESTLHLLALAGGWPGALVAQQKLRHKSRKQPFRLLCWLTVLLNAAGFAWLLTAEGSAATRRLIDTLL
ncbi:DUF1294 domain-containing protein [Motiliproteus sediminis]|uniref:DUF1294 domain-containing protein n=1 Tax=Motiliproteus sediminis TaxID=1468178 RepID=UPI001AEF3D1B|nr:DUF1294 domain-containing protein [Motiliproteus sediminis]